MSLKTDNFKLYKYEDNDIGDLRFMQDSMDTIDKGLVLDVGTSTGTGNDYVLNIGSITLSNTNKGIAFRFWADKDSTGAVKINTNYNLLKGVGKPVSNLKAGNPYTIVYDGGTNFFLGSGSSVDSDKVTATEKDVLINKTYIGSDEEIHTGTMPELGDVTKTLGINETFTLPEGHINSLTVTQNIPTIGAKTYTPTTTDQIISAGRYLSGNQTIKGDANLKSENIVTGVSIFGVRGNGYSRAQLLNRIPLEISYTRQEHSISLKSDRKAEEVKADSNILYDSAHNTIRYETLSGRYKYVNLNSWSLVSEDSCAGYNFQETSNKDKVRITTGQAGTNSNRITSTSYMVSNTLSATVSGGINAYTHNYMNYMVLPNNDILVICGWDDNSYDGSIYLYLNYFVRSYSFSY